MIVPARFMNRKWFIKSAKCAQCSHRWGIFRWIPNKRNCTTTFSVHRHRHPFKLHGMVRWWRISATASPPFDSTTRKTNYWLLQTIVDGVRVRSSNLICGVKKIIIDNFSTSEDSLQQQQHPPRKKQHRNIINLLFEWIFSRSSSKVDAIRFECRACTTHMRIISIWFDWEIKRLRSLHEHTRDVTGWKCFDGSNPRQSLN